MDNTTKILEILGSGYLMSLATQDDGGVWVADVTYIYDQGMNIYWMSSPHTRHSKALLSHSQAAASITVSTRSKEDNFGIQLSGNAEKIDGPRYDLAKLHASKRGNPEPKEEDDVLGTRSWYVLKPTLIDIIDEKNLGFKKITVKL